MRRQALLEALAEEYPRVEGEGTIHYAQRLAVLAGFLARKDASLIGADEDVHAKGRQPAGQPRLPFKESE